jgi:hypothetical protein
MSDDGKMDDETSDGSSRYAMFSGDHCLALGDAESYAMDKFYTVGASVTTYVKVGDDGMFRGMIGEDIRVSFELDRVAQSNVAFTLGPHVSKVTILKPNCSYPRITL